MLRPVAALLVEGITQVQPGTTLTSTPGPAPSNVQTASPLVSGQLRIMFTTNQVLRAGLDTPVSFRFVHAGTLTLLVPMGAVSDTADLGR